MSGEELLEDIKIIRKNLEALHKEVAGLTKRAQEQGKHLGRADLDEVLAKVKQETRFEVPFDLVAERIQPHLATPAKLEAAMVGGIQRVEQLINQFPRSIPIKGAVWGFTNWRVGLLSVGTPVLLMLLMCWFPGMFSRVSKADYEELRTQHEYSEAQLRSWRQMRRNLLASDSLLAYRYFPATDDPKPTAAPTPVPSVLKKKHAKRR